MSHVLEHVRDDISVMKSVSGLLSDGGSLLVQIPIDLGREQTREDWSITSPEGRLAAFGQEDHVRLYGRDFVKRLETAGLSVVEVNPADVCNDELIALMSLSDTIFVCTKRDDHTGTERRNRLVRPPKFSSSDLQAKRVP
jgi:hypothetical protein